MAETTTAFGAPVGMSLLVGPTGGYALPLVIALVLVTRVGAGLFHWGTTPSGDGSETVGTATD